MIRAKWLCCFPSLSPSRLSKYVFYTENFDLKKKKHSKNLRCKGIWHLKHQKVNTIGWRNILERTDAGYRTNAFRRLGCGTLVLAPVKAIFRLPSLAHCWKPCCTRVVSSTYQTKLLDSGCLSALLSYNKSELFQLLLTMPKKTYVSIICQPNSVVHDYLPATLIDFCSAK